MKKFVLLHGLGFWYNECFGPGLIKAITDIGAEYRAAEFPLFDSGKLSYESWTKGLDDLTKDFPLDENTVVICHSLSTFLILKYLTNNKCKIDTLITISGAKLNKDYTTNSDAAKDPANSSLAKDPNFAKFLNTDKEYNYVKNNVKNKYCFYSNGDHYFSLESLEAYADAIGGKKMFLKDRGHFGRKAGNTGIPELEELVKKIGR